MVLMVWMVLVVAVVNVEAGLKGFRAATMDARKVGASWVPRSASALDVGASFPGTSSEAVAMSTLIGCKEKEKEKKEKEKEKETGRKRKKPEKEEERKIKSGQRERSRRKIKCKVQSWSCDCVPRTVQTRLGVEVVTFMEE